MIECSCEKCQQACKNKPGWFLPGEAEKAAELKGLSLKDFFNKYLMVDWLDDDDTNVVAFLLSPAVLGGETGQEFPANPSGQCIFFDDGKCDIYSARPHECRTYHHDMPLEVSHPEHIRVGNEWKTHQNQITELLEREPEAEKYSIWDGLTKLNELIMGGSFFRD